MSNNFTNETEHVLRVEETTMPGTLNYNRLNNKPKIEGVTLEGDITLDEIGIEAHRFEEYVEQAQESATQSAQYASAAEAHKTAAEGSKNAAAQSASNASASAQSASQSVTQAQTYAGNASASATQAQTYASNASASATQAGSSATQASASATQAQGYAQNAAQSAGEAETLKDGTQAIVDAAKDDVIGMMDNYARTDGCYDGLTSGTAKDLVSTQYTAEDKAPYLFRKSITGDRELDTLVGGSIAWNQLIPVRVTQSSQTVDGVTITNNQDGSFTITGTATADVSKSLTTSSLNIIANHIYYMPQPKGASASGYFLRTGEATFWNYKEIGKGAANDVNNNIRLIVLNGTTVNVTFYLQWFDLTQAFNPTVADRLYAMEQAQTGSGVALFRSWFPKDYYAYNAGTLMSVKTSAHETVGFNQWDEEWRNGYYNEQTGEFIANSAYVANKNPIPAFPNTDYYGVEGSNYVDSFLCYDKSMNYLGTTTRNSDNTRTTKPNTAYINFRTRQAYGGTYKNDICISISSDRNGEYEPYTKHTYALDDVELRGVMKLDGMDIYFDGDTYEADGTVTRKYYKLSGADFVLHNTSSAGYITYRCYTANTGHTASEGYNILSNFTSNVVSSLNSSTVSEECIQYVSPLDSSKAIYIALASTRNIADLELIYELATPTTETADQFAMSQQVVPYGTERYIDERAVAVPVGHVTKYSESLIGRVENLPTEYASIITNTASGSVASFTDGAKLPMKSVNVTITPKQSGSGDPSPSNVRPITGTSTANVTAVGKNLFNIGGGRYTYGKFPAGTRLYMQSNASTAFNVYARINGAGVVVDAVGGSLGKRIITLSGDADAIVITQADYDSLVSNSKWFMLSYTDFTDFVPYTGHTTPVPLGQTVYGGEVDVATGALTIDRAMVQVTSTMISGASAYEYSGKNGVSFTAFPVNVDKYTGSIKGSSSISTVEAGAVSKNQYMWFGTANGNKVVYWIGILDALEMTLAEWKVWANEQTIQLVYPLTTPTTVQLTPAQVATLLGTNNVWSDAGDIEVAYRADTKMYIDNKFAELQALVLENL